MSLMHKNPRQATFIKQGKKQKAHFLNQMIRVTKVLTQWFDTIVSTVHTSSYINNDKPFRKLGLTVCFTTNRVTVNL